MTMSECPADASPVESDDPLENGLRILARIIARDIAAKRADAARARKFQNTETNETPTGV
jgi:hypothetical protein